ncbi:HK97 gp10 family phage protein [Gorillibacterium sp. sgz500922]|uniref:HK97 gp10 family phage protein n=1 Tax=Gorillibacterium sp. sgz500922 TaxID=3446694 RepID=UPI003F676D2D
MPRMGDFDFGELERFAGDLKGLQQAMPSFLEACVRELALILLTKAVKRTPVDTGQLRRNWTIGPVHRVGDSYEVEVYNPTDYAMYVEFGHRLRTKSGWGWTEGRFMLTISEQELERELPAILDRKLQAMLDRHLGGR